MGEATNELRWELRKVFDELISGNRIKSILQQKHVRDDGSIVWIDVPTVEEE